MNNIKCTLAEILNILVTSQKALQGSNKRKEVALIATSSGTKKKGNKKKKGKTRVVKSTGRIAKNKGKAIIREEQGKENVSIAKVKDIGKGIVLSSLSLSR